MLGLVLTGGGARGAYQIGVLKAFADISAGNSITFPILSGVSVGALNIAGLAANHKSFNQAVSELETFWRQLRTDQVFDTRLSRFSFTGLRLVLAEFMPTFFRKAPKSLLNNDPLRVSLRAHIDFSKISEGLAAGDLKAVSITCSGYRSGEATTFFEADSQVRPWKRVRREGRKTQLSLDHIMASAALPLLFPAVKIDGEYFGDGALRLTSPLAPAIHMGANRLAIIGTRDDSARENREDGKESEYPSIGDLGGYALDTIFNDSLDADIERMERVNQLLAQISKTKRKKQILRQIQIFSINPSKSLREVAMEHLSEMPRSLRWMIKRQGTAQAAGRIESYLLFEPGYIGHLIDLGYRDAMAKKTEIVDFLFGAPV